MNAEKTNWFMGKIRTIHFIGIGGIGMSGLAEILINLGFTVQGSDQKESPVTDRLRHLGARVFIGHQREQIKGADVIVYSSAVTADNPEIIAGHQAKLSVIRRAELLAELMRLQYGIAVAGTHGKTTTTTMTALILEEAGLDPTIVVGGNANNIGTNAKIGKGKFFVAEADESDESFLLLAPVIAVVTNIEEEHLDHYSDLHHIMDTFSKFLEKVPFFGSAILCGDDLNIQKMIMNYPRAVTTYGLDLRNDLQIFNRVSHDSAQEFMIRYRDVEHGPFNINIPGMHMVLNATAAMSVGLQLGISWEKMVSALAKYRGVKRRMEWKGQIDDVIILDDYAHHPTEIKATLDAVREAWKKPLTLVFQPHRYTRTKFFMDDFARVLSGADKLILMPVYAASEQPITGVDSETLAGHCRRHGHPDVICLPGIDQAVDHLAKTMRPGQIVITMGAGSVFQVGEKLVKCLSR